MQVYTKDGRAIVDAEREVTIKHLLTHTSGLIYESDKDDHPIDQRYEEADLYGGDLANMVNRLGGIPLPPPPRDGMEIRYVYRYTRLPCRHRLWDAV